MARPAKPAKLIVDGVWGQKSRTMLAYVIDVTAGKQSGTTKSWSTAMGQLSKAELKQVQSYLNHEYSKWDQYYDGGIYGWKTLAKLAVDGVWGYNTSNAFTNYIAYCCGVLSTFYMGSDSGWDIWQWDGPTVEVFQIWLNAARDRKTPRQELGGTGGAVPYLP